MKKLVWIIILVMLAGCGSQTNSESNVKPTNLESNVQPTKAIITLPKEPVIIFKENDIHHGDEIYRIFDQEAQVVCYVYNNIMTMGNPPQPATYFGISCLPVSETNLK